MSQDVLAMSRLGKMGRFANQVIQYAFLKTYCRRHHLTAQTPPWIGNDLFGLRDAAVDRELPEFHDPDDKDRQRALIPQRSEPLRNVDVVSYCQYHSSYYSADRDYIRDLFTPRREIREPLEAASAKLRSAGETVIALHIRRGDYGKAYFYLTPTAWYRQWLAEVWSKWPNPVLYIATDDPDEVLPDFADYHPYTARRLRVRLPRARFYPDFYLLSQADVLAMPNSTFSFAAAMLNRRLRRAYRSHLSDPLSTPPFRELDPWNADMLDISADVSAYPQIPGIRRWHRHRPRWQRKLIRLSRSLWPLRNRRAA